MVANFRGDDLILAQITSVNGIDEYSLMLLKNDFEDGGLKSDSVMRSNRLFTCRFFNIVLCGRHCE